MQKRKQVALLVSIIQDLKNEGMYEQISKGDDDRMVVDK